MEVMVKPPADSSNVQPSGSANARLGLKRLVA